MIKKVFLLLFYIMLLFPVYFMLIGSLQNNKGVMQMPPKLLPHDPTLMNYKALKNLNIVKWSANTLFVTIGTVFLSVLVSTTGGYVFAFFKFKFKNIIWAALLIGIMVPRISIIIPVYVIIKKLHLSGTLLATILPVVFSPMGLYLSRAYFETIPISLLEAARIDGASEFQVLSKIVLPVSMPIISALSIFAAVGSLQDYIWQALVLQDPDRQTLLVGLMRYSMERGGDLGINPIGKALTVGVILLLPLLVIFLFANKYFVANIGGAVKE